MDDFEKLIVDALRRENPPMGFEQRVLAATAPRHSRWGWVMAIAAATIMAAGGGWQYEQHRRERQQGEMAKAKLELALKITTAKLTKIQKTLDSHYEGL